MAAGILKRLHFEEQEGKKYHQTSHSPGILLEVCLLLAMDSKSC